MGGKSQWIRRCVVMLAFAAVCAGCSKKAPEEANQALDDALNALAKGDEKAYIEKVVPDQREQVTQGAGQWEFFRNVKSHKIDNEFDLNVTDTTASIQTVLYFDDEADAHSNIRFFMKKVKDDWLIDLAETIKSEREMNQGDAFKVWKIKVSPG